MTNDQNKVELFRAFKVEELASRLQHGSYYGYGDEYYGCSEGQGYND